MSDWEPGWEALARATKARRDRLRISQAEVERRGGPSTATQRKIERQYADNISSDALFQMDEGLGWFRGTSQSIVDGDLGHYLMSFDEFVEDAINDTRELRNKGITYPVLPREKVVQPPTRVAPPGPVPTATDRHVTWGEMDRAFRYAERYESLRDVDPDSPEYRPAFDAITDQLSLDTLHERIDSLDRPRKLQVSTYVDELRQPRKDSQDAQEPEPQQGTGGPAGGGTGGGGTPMTGAESETPVRDPIPDHLSGESTRSAQ